VGEGDVVAAVYFVVRGEVGLSLSIKMGVRPLRLVDLGPGGFFGEACHVARKEEEGPHRFPYMVTAKDYCELLSIPAEAYIKLAKEHDEINTFVNPIFRA
jgi:CRP-like cAMP-binding protein